MGEPDQELWRACIVGDADAFGGGDRQACGCGLPVLPALVRVLARRRGTRIDHLFGGVGATEQAQTAEDMVLPWLLGVVTNANRNRASASRRYTDFVARLPHLDPRHGEHAADHAESVASRLDAEHVLRELLDRTAGLNDGERDVAILCLMNGIGQDEAAKAFGVRAVRVKSRLHRAKVKLAKMTGYPEVGEQFDTTIVEARQP